MDTFWTWTWSAGPKVVRLSERRKKNYKNNMFRFIARNYFSTVYAVIVTLRAMTSNNETVPSQNLWAGNIGKFRMSEGNSALLPSNVDWQRPLQQNLMDFQLQNFQLYKSLKDWILVKQLILFPLSRVTQLTVSLGISHLINKLLMNEAKYLLKNYGDRGGCYLWPWRIIPSEISIILHMIWKPNSRIVLLFTQNNS